MINSSSKKENFETGEDRIGSLPDELLIRILSLLSTRDALRTSLLSSRWENLWASVPNLSFCPFNGRTEGWTEAFNLRFMNFIDRILLLHNSSIHQFHLNSTPKIDKSRVSAWISTVVKRNVRDITISDYYTENYCPNLRLPRCLFNCKTLESLKLGHCLQLNVPSSVHLPRLKVLHVMLNAPGKDVNENLFCSSPVLEELKLVVHNDSGISNYIVSSSALKKMSITIYADRLEDYDSMVTIDAPVLEELEVSDECYLRYNLKKVSSLIKVSVSVDVFSRYDVYLGNMHGMHQVRELYRLLTKISNVKNLFLDCWVVEAFRVDIERKWPVFPNLTHLRLEVFDVGFEAKSLSKWPIFPNLQHLHLNVSNGFGSKNLSHWLIWAPNLSSLVIAKESSLISTEEELESSEQQGVLTCLQSCLKKVEVCKLDNLLESALELIKYLLESAQALETLIIEHCKFEDLSEEEFQSEILAMPRCSKLCQVVFV